MGSRRDALKLAAAGFVAALLGSPKVALGAGRDARPRGPRYLLSIYLSGGIDPVTSADPKLRSEVEPWVDVPYGPDAIVEAGGLRLGPHLAPLAPHASRLTILRGVALRTANHNTGSEQFLRMRTGTRPAMPTLLDVLGARRDGQAVGCIDWLFGAGQFARLFGGGPRDELAELGRLLRAEARRVRSLGAGRDTAATAASVEDTAELFERVARLEPPRIERWSTRAEDEAVAVALQRILWVFEHDLARAFELNIGGVEQPWDTHTFNTDRQRAASAPLAMIGRFFGELGKRSARGRPLVDQTLVVMGSEIGRFPALNGARGKDHFPEASFLLYGAGMRNAAFGRTARDMTARPISPRTGAEAPAGAPPLLLDDLGATLLRLGGVEDPRVYGYDGRILEFLGAG